jgi:hypothetical protein
MNARTTVQSTVQNGAIILLLSESAQLFFADEYY